MRKTYETFEKAGVPLFKVSKEDNLMFWEVYYKHAVNNLMANAERVGVLDEARLVQRYMDEMKWGDYK